MHIGASGDKVLGRLRQQRGALASATGNHASAQNFAANAFRCAAAHQPHSAAGVSLGAFAGGGSFRGVPCCICRAWPSSSLL